MENVMTNKVNEVAGSLYSALGRGPGSMLKSSDLVTMQRNENEKARFDFFLLTNWQIFDIT